MEKQKLVNIAAERAVIAGICKYGAEVYVNVSGIIDESCFSLQDNQTIYRCINSILTNSSSVDISSIMSTAMSLGYGDLFNNKDMSEYVKSMFLFSVNKENVKTNAVILKKLAMTRHAQHILKNVWDDLLEIKGTEPIGEIISKIEGPVLSMDFSSDGTNSHAYKIGDSGDEILEHFASLRGKTVGVPSPYPKYNKVIGGGRRPGYIYIKAARPKVGKTQDAISDALFVAEYCNIPVLYLDTEMQEVDMTARMWANLSNTETNIIENGEFSNTDFHTAKINAANEKLKKLPLYYVKISGKPFEEVLSIIRRWVTQEVGLVDGVANPCFIVYDYFKLMDATVLENMQEYQAMGFQISALSDFIGKYKIPCSAYVQLSRAGIDGDGSECLSQSDRLLWLCGSVAMLKRKTADEIAVDGAENGNLKLMVNADQRFGPGLEDGDYINIKAQLDRCILTEGLTHRELQSQAKKEGFEIIEDEESEDGFTDSDFDGANYRDDQYRTY